MKQNCQYLGDTGKPLQLLKTGRVKLENWFQSKLIELIWGTSQLSKSVAKRLEQLFWKMITW